MVFSVEISMQNQTAPRVELFLDDDGLALFIRKLELIKQGGSHDHLMTPGWAGNELTEEKINPSSVLVNMINVRCVPSKNIPDIGDIILRDIKMFTVEIDGYDSGDPVIEMSLDEGAFVYLIRVLNNIKETKGQHFFMTPSYGGNELTEAKMDPSNVLVNQLVITHYFYEATVRNEKHQSLHSP